MPVTRTVTAQPTLVPTAVIPAVPGARAVITTVLLAGAAVNVTIDSAGGDGPFEVVVSATSTACAALTWRGGENATVTIVGSVAAGTILIEWYYEHA